MPTTRRFSIVIHQKRVGRIQQTRSHVGPTRRRLVLVARRAVLRELVKRLTPMGKHNISAVILTIEKFNIHLYLFLDLSDVQCMKGCAI